MKEKVLITGATGFIGRFACDVLAAKGWDVHTTVHRRADFPGGNFEAHRCDLFDGRSTRELLLKIRPSHLLHFAWYAEHGKYWRSLENLKWVQASLGLLMDFKEAGGRRAVLAGSCAEYKWGGSGPLSEEQTPAEPSTLYGECKNSLRRILGRFSAETGLSSAWGRIFFLYGPHEAKTRLVPSVITSLLAGRPARCTHGEQVRDFLHVKDVAGGFAALLESGVQGPVNIGSGLPVPLKSVICRIGEMLGRSDLIELGAIKAPEGEPPVIVADIKKLANEVVFAPSFTLEDGLTDTIKWWQNNPDA